jgi:hypothetical protein
LPLTVQLAGGSTITVRHAAPDDEPRLRAFYHGLSPIDRYHRFFSAFDPPERTLRAWLDAAADGGCRLLAETDDGRIVGDCGWFPMPDSPSEAEFDITVSPDMRGWLGPFLLDQLVQEAHRRDLTNLHAIVLRDNRPMLALVRSRGYVQIGHQDRTSVHVVIAAGDGMPAWPEGEVPGAGARSGATDRLLVEARGGEWHAADSARSFGFRVAVCPGPRPDDPSSCPARRGEPCPLARDADAIVVALPDDDPDAQALLDAHRSLHPHAVLCHEAAPARGRAPEAEGGASVHLERGDPMSAARIAEALGRPAHLPHRKQPGGDDA